MYQTVISILEILKIYNQICVQMKMRKCLKSSLFHTDYVYDIKILCSNCQIINQSHDDGGFI
jgi:hypothetical protein